MFFIGRFLTQIMDNGTMSGNIISIGDKTYTTTTTIEVMYIL